MRKRFLSLPIGILMITAILMAGCAKKVEEIKKNAVVDAMTNGRWLVQTFTENTSDVSSEFTGYEFQFVADGSVFGIKGASQTGGVWVGDANALTIYSNFPVANDTLKRLNETWKIFNNTFTLVEAKPSNLSHTAYLKLVKKP